MLCKSTHNRRTKSLKVVETEFLIKDMHIAIVIEAKMSKYKKWEK